MGCQGGWCCCYQVIARLTALTSNVGIKGLLRSGQVDGAWWCWLLPIFELFRKKTLPSCSSNKKKYVPGDSKSSRDLFLSQWSRFRHPKKVTKNCQVCFFLLVRSFPQVVSWYLPSCLQLGKTALVCRAWFFSPIWTCHLKRSGI